jgi:hypothetical protein
LGEGERLGDIGGNGDTAGGRWCVLNVGFKQFQIPAIQPYIGQIHGNIIPRILTKSPKTPKRLVP